MTGRNKNSIENYFDYSFELENTLVKHGKDELLQKVKIIHGMVNIYYVRQNHSLGLGHSIIGVQEVNLKDVSKYGVIKAIKEY